MSLTTDSKINIALKKIYGTSHTSNLKDPANEADSSYIITLAKNVWTQEIPSDTTAAVNANIAEKVVAELEYDITSNGKSYWLKYPAGHPKQGQRIYDIIPDQVSSNYEPLLYRDYSTGTRIYKFDSSDWVFDPANGTITSEDNLNLTSAARCVVYVYIGKRLSDPGSTGGTVFFLEEFVYNGQSTLDLSHTPVDGVMLTVYGGIPQDSDVDFGVSGSSIVISGYPLADILSNGDKIQVSYSYIAS